MTECKDREIPHRGEGRQAGGGEGKDRTNTFIQQIAARVPKLRIFHRSSCGNYQPYTGDQFSNWATECVRKGLRGV